MAAGPAGARSVTSAACSAIPGWAAVTAHFTIDPDGRVASATADGIHDSELEVCVAGVVRAIVVATRDGTLFGLDVDTGYTLWSYAIGHRIVAEPVIARGWVYAGTADGFVIALEVGDRTLDGWHMFGGNPHHDGPVTVPPLAAPAPRAAAL